MTKIKICGITNKVDAVNASRLGADMLGFVFCKGSKRYVTTASASGIVNELPPSIGKVGVFADESREDVLRIAEDVGLDTLQFHGNETPEYCASFRPDYKVIKAFRLKDAADLKKVNDYDVDYYLFDTYQDGRLGGTGKTFDWNMLKDFEVLKPVMISGGLKADNVVSAIKELVPFGVDVSSGVEKSPGKKDLGLLTKFIDNVRKA